MEQRTRDLRSLSLRGRRSAVPFISGKHLPDMEDDMQAHLTQFSRGYLMMDSMVSISLLCVGIIARNCWTLLSLVFK